MIATNTPPNRPIRSAQDIDRIAHLEKCLAQARAELVEERNTSKRFRDRLHICIDEMKIEADHATLRSTEAAMDLRDLSRDADDRDIERMIEDDEGPKERDYIAELRDANKLVGTLRFAMERGQRSEAQLDEEIASLKRRNRDLLDTNNRYLERARAGRAVLRRILKAIEKALDDKVIIDTFWTADVSAETVVDAIEHELDKRINP